ncbi:MAG: ArdC-like ssDNA-binding domain-containing protein, partial [Cyclobacteriaceae bacterium]
MKTTHEKKDMYAIINNMILDKLQQGMPPWKQTWNSFGPARNYLSGKPYRGINAMILVNSGFEYPLFMTFLQAKELGGCIKKGSESIPVIYYKKLLIENGEDVKSIPFLRYYNVFNIDCVEGIRFKLPAKYQNDPIDGCERIVAEMTNKPAIQHGGDEPHYNPKLDRVTIPERSNFTTSDEFYATLYHELSHSTGHESRLHRESLIQPSPYGS